MLNSLNEQKDSKRMENELENYINSMEECTFKPRINELPSQYGPPKNANIPFHERILRWKHQKDTMLDHVTFKHLQKQIVIKIL